jgi:hypothetical protein
MKYFARINDPKRATCPEDMVISFKYLKRVESPSSSKVCKAKVTRYKHNNMLNSNVEKIQVKSTI